MRIVVFAAVLCLWGCAHKPGVYRLVASPTEPVLTPPVSANAGVQAGPTKRGCAVSPHGLRLDVLRRHKAALHAERATLDALTPDELFAWTAQLESQGCIPPGGSGDLREAVINALPLPVSRRFALRYGQPAMNGSLDLGAWSSLRVVSPVFRQGATPGPVLTQSKPTVAAGTNGSIDVTLEASPSLIGYEVAWYDVQPRPGGKGLAIVPRSAQEFIEGKPGPTGPPHTNYFHFGVDASVYRLFILTRASSNDFDFAVVSGPDAPGLEQRTGKFRADANAFIGSVAKDSYAAIPKGVGVNAQIRVTVHGTRTDVAPGATVRQAILQTGVADIPSGLRLRKPHRLGLLPVEGDNLLLLNLEGGEQIDW